MPGWAAQNLRKRPTLTRQIRKYLQHRLTHYGPDDPARHALIEGFWRALDNSLLDDQATAATVRAVEHHTPEQIRWEDLGRERDYDGQGALMQGGLLNDLLCTGYARIRPSPKVRYVLYNPGSVATALSGEYDAYLAAQIQAMRSTAQPVEKAIVPILDLLNDPPAQPLTASVLGRPIVMDGPGFDPHAVQRLYDHTRELIA
jgi:cytochrome c553